MQIVILGPPGSGKGTQAQILASRMGWAWFSTGDVLRNEIEKNTPRAQKVRNFVETGSLVADEIILDLAKEFLLNNNNHSIVFDGFPRTLKQAEGLDQLLGRHLDCAVFLELSKKEAVARLKSRFVCLRCGETYNVVTNPPKKSGVCDRCLGKLKLRADDREEIINTRFAVYNQVVGGLYRYYSNQGIAKKVDARGGIEEVHNRIMGLWGSS